MKYSLGLDIGITSVGWAVLNLDANRIEDLGVRAFNAAEVPKTRESLAKPRREKKGARVRLKRRRGRLDRAKAMFAAYGLLSDPESVFTDTTAKKTPEPNPWQLRADGLSRLLSGEEFSRALYHIAKHRGFKSNRKHEKPSDTDSRKMLAGVEGMRRMLVERGYQTVGQMMHCDGEFMDRKRNRDREYSHTVEREMLEDEVRSLFDAQRRLGSKLASVDFELDFLSEAFNWQKPFASGDDILKKVGLCTFEGKNDERRAPRSSWTAERFDLLCKINNLQIELNGDRKRLSDEERQIVERMAYERLEVTYKRIRKKLGIPDQARFAGTPLRYRKRKEGRLVEDMDCEGSTFRQLSGYQSLKKAMTSAGVWDSVKDDPDMMDDLTFALTFYKTDRDIRACLAEREIPNAVIEAAATAPTFKAVANLSIKAMRNIIPHLERGLRYDEACTAAGYSHYNPKGEVTRGLKLPPVERQYITNPVVVRALSQARKAVNHIVARHGAPTYVSIELATDIGKSAKERDRVTARSEENRRYREEDNAHFREFFDNDPRGEDRVKWRLYHEQNGHCVYSLQPIDLKRLLEAGYVEIDHILPYSRSMDNRMSNRVLVHCKENRDKGDQTPQEYFSANPARRDAFTGWVKTTYQHNRDKRENLLKEDFPARQKEWMERSISDTRYATSFFADFIRYHLQFADPAVKAPVRCFAGGITSLARGLWGLGRRREEKVRVADDLHHALDAAVIAMLTPGRIKFITDYSQAKETGRVTEITDYETGEVYEVFRDKPFQFPPPWKHFRDELLARLWEDPTEAIKQLNLPSYEGMTDLRPIIVSRMPQRGASGAIHKDTMRSTKGLERMSSVRTRLTDLTMADLDHLLAPETNEKLYAAIRERMAPYANEKKPGLKAFGDSNSPFHKPMNADPEKPDAKPSVVRSVKVCKTQNEGVSIRKGIADHAKIVRTDIYRQQNHDGTWRYGAVPVYLWNTQNGDIPAIPGEFLFSLYLYDLVRVKTDDRDFLGYYRSFDRDSGRIDVSWPNRNHLQPKEKWPRFTMGTIRLIEKYHIGVLGDYHLVVKEVRLGLAHGSDIESGETEDRE